MAPKHKSEPPARPNRVRFVLLEADLSDDNFGAFTQAITQALKPAPQSPQRQLPLSARQAPMIEGHSDGTDTIDDEAIEEQEEEEAQVHVAPSPKAARNKPKLPVPTFVYDLDINGSGKAFKDFAVEVAPSTTTKKYLAVALWLRDFGGKASVNINDMYTCFKTAGWSIAINDWDGTFRTLVKTDSMRRVSTGEYTITHLGEAALQKADK